VLYFHGNAGNLAVRAGRFNAFHKRGYGIVAAGYRGSSGSTGTPGETALIDDARTLAASLHGPVVYYGESLGAALAIALAETDPPAALVLEAPFTSLADMSAHLYGSPALVRLLKSRWPSLARIAQVSAPLLILHGAQDSLVPPAQGRALLNAAASPEKRLYLVEGAGHTNVWQPDAQRVLFAFLDGV
ncbi:MAG TPA: alpha/beta hydrolase, partial [Rhodobacterales bacterium]|nr:alpha/beta hydrolase [Rhodobacterales bacterium]